MVQVTAVRRPQPSTWPAYGACIGALLYGAMKIDLALNRQAGIAGFPNRPGHEQDHGGQWGNVAVAVVCAAVALATVQSWGRIIPRWILLAASWTICVGLGAGAVVLVLRSSAARSCLRRPAGRVLWWPQPRWCGCSCGVRPPCPTSGARVVAAGRGQNDASPQCRSTVKQPPHGGRA